MSDRFHQGGGARGDWAVTGDLAVGGGQTLAGDFTGQGVIQTQAVGSGLRILDSGFVEKLDIFYNGTSAIVVAAGGITVSSYLTADGSATFYQNVTFSQDVAVTGSVTWSGPDLSGAHAGGVTLTGQSTTGGLVNPLTIQAKNSAGTIVSRLLFGNSGGITVTNDSSLSAPFALNSGHAKADGWGQSAEQNIGTVTTTATVSWLLGGASQRVTLTNATNCTFTFTAPPIIGWLTLRVIAPASGSVGTLTWPSTVKWASATKPVPNVVNRSNIFRFYYDGTNYWGDAILNAA